MFKLKNINNRKNSKNCVERISGCCVVVDYIMIFYTNEAIALSALNLDFGKGIQTSQTLFGDLPKSMTMMESNGH